MQEVLAQHSSSSYSPLFAHPLFRGPFGWRLVSARFISEDATAGVVFFVCGYLGMSMVNNCTGFLPYNPSAIGHLQKPLLGLFVCLLLVIFTN